MPGTVLADACGPSTAIRPEHGGSDSDPREGGAGGVAGRRAQEGPPQIALHLRSETAAQSTLTSRVQAPRSPRADLLPSFLLPAPGPEGPDWGPSCHPVLRSGHSGCKAHVLCWTLTCTGIHLHSWPLLQKMEILVQSNSVSCKIPLPETSVLDFLPSN